MAPPTSVSTKSNAGLGESYEMNAFHSNGNLQTHLRLPHVNRNKRLTARILQLRHTSGSLINSDQEMAELLEMTFLGFCREDERSTAVLHSRTQTHMTDPLITELEVRRALDGLNPHKGAGPDGLFPEVLKALNSHIVPVLALYLFNLSHQTAAQ